jgi:DNA-binding CsgD family transcriptional regulator
VSLVDHKLSDRLGELNKVAEAFGALTERSGQVVLVSGPSGSGRTSFLTACAERAAAAGLPVIRGKFSSFDRALSENFDESTPCVVCLDDVDLADQYAVLQIARHGLRLGWLRGVLVLAYGEMSFAGPPEWAMELAHQPHALQVTLGAPDELGVMELAQRTFGVQLDTREVSEMIWAAGANLNLLHALIADWQRSGNLGRAGTDAKPMFRQAVQACYRRCGPTARRVAQAIAVLAEFGSPRALTELTGEPISAVDAALAELTWAGLLFDGEFRHQSVPSAILADLSMDAAAELHHRAAQVLREMGAPALEVTRRLVVADRSEESWTVYLLHESLPQAMQHDDRELALQALRLAHRSSRDPALRALVLARIATVYAGTDPDLSCQYLHEACYSMPDEQLWGDYSALLCEHYVRRGQGPLAATRLLDAARRTTGSQPGQLASLDAQRLLIHSDYPALLAKQPELSGAVGGIHLEDTLHPRCWAPSLLIQALISNDFDPDASFQTRAALFQCSMSQETHALSVAALTALVYADKVSAVQALAEELTELAAVRRAPVWQARYLAVRAAAEVRAGQYAAAVAAVEHALVLAPVPFWGVRIGDPMSSLMLGHIGMQRPDAALSYLNKAVPTAMFETRYALHYLYARGHLKLATGRALAALADFVSCGQLMIEWGVDRERIVPWRLAAAGAKLCIGDTDGAVELIDRRLKKLQPRPAEAPQAASEIPLRRRSEREAIFEKLTNAVHDNALLEGIRAIQEQRHHREHRSNAQYKIEDRYSAYLNKLSSSERNVALLAAAGGSNRQIARSLSITISTVEQHLTSTYRKLEFAGRQELRARLG